jgi:hypothetical protein
MTPEAIYQQAASETVRNLFFSAAWAAATVWLLPKIWWWLAVASFVGLALITLLEFLRLGGLFYTLAAMPKGELDARQRRYLRLAVVVQTIGEIVGVALVIWVYRALW